MSRLNSVKRGSMIVIGILLIVLGGVLILKSAKKFYDDLILDNRYHYLSCDELPSLIEVDRVVLEHREIVEKIVREIGRANQGRDVVPLVEQRQVRDGDLFTVIFYWGESERCPGTGRGEINIRYPSHRNRVQIEQIIHDKTFFGIPYNLINT